MSFAILGVGDSASPHMQPPRALRQRLLAAGATEAQAMAECRQAEMAQVGWHAADSALMHSCRLTNFLMQCVKLPLQAEAVLPNCRCWNHGRPRCGRR